MRCTCIHGRMWRCTKGRLRTKGNLEEMSHISDLNHHEGGTFSESTHVSIHRYCILLPPDKHFPCFYFHLCGNSFLQSKRARALSLATGLVARIWHSQCFGLTSVSGCMKPGCGCLSRRCGGKWPAGEGGPGWATAAWSAGRLGILGARPWRAGSPCVLRRSAS